MNTSIVNQLVRKDFLISRTMILRFFFFSLVSIGIVSLLIDSIPHIVLLNLVFMLLIGPVVTCGLVLLMKTNVFEKEKSTQAFIMSLPVTVREFTIAKLVINLSVFSVLWLVVSGVAFYFSFGMDLLPLGTGPFLTMILLGVFVAYCGILAVSLLFQTLGVTVISIVVFELLTTVYLWVIVYLEPIGDHIYGESMVWNSTAIMIVAAQVLTAIAIILMTLVVQTKKRDFI